jgi:hypothetical protein
MESSIPPVSQNQSHRDPRAASSMRANISEAVQFFATSDGNPVVSAQGGCANVISHRQDINTDIMV